MGRCKKKPKVKFIPKDTKEPKANITNINSWKKNNPVWKFNKFDKEHSDWGFKNFCYEKVIDALSNFEGMTWHEIEAQSGGKKTGTNSHFISADKLIKEAQKRLSELNLEDYSDDIFSLRINSKHRLFGILKNGIFEILWNDNEHVICECKK